MATTPSPPGGLLPVRLTTWAAAMLVGDGDETGALFATVSERETAVVMTSPQEDVGEPGEHRGSIPLLSNSTLENVRFNSRFQRLPPPGPGVTLDMTHLAEAALKKKLRRSSKSSNVPGRMVAPIGPTASTMARRATSGYAYQVTMPFRMSAIRASAMAFSDLTAYSSARSRAIRAAGG